MTIFPEMFPGPLGLSLAGKALERGDWRLDAVDLRGFTGDRHQTVDDTPFGGGAGMVMRPDIVARAVDELVASRRARAARLSQPARRAVAPGARARARGRARASCCCAAATRASTIA